MERPQRRSFTDDYKRQAVDLVASSGRSIGSCYDNAPMSFFHTLKTELVHHQHYATREQASVDRKWLAHLHSDANDPGCVKTSCLL